MGRWRDAPTLSFSTIYSSSSTHSLSVLPLSPNLPPPLGFISHHWHLTFSSLCPSFLHWCQFALWYLSLGLLSSLFVLQIVFCFIYFKSYGYLLFTWNYQELLRNAWWRISFLTAPKFRIHICANYLIIYGSNMLLKIYLEANSLSIIICLTLNSLKKKSIKLLLVNIECL